MSRSGLHEFDGDDALQHGRWRAQVASATRGKRGQKFFRELAAEMDAMPVKELIRDELINAEGQCCAIGVTCKSRGIDVSEIDYNCAESVGAAVDIAHQLAAEIEFYNDECSDSRWVKAMVPMTEHYKHCAPRILIRETPEERWQRMRKWVDEQIAEKD